MLLKLIPQENEELTKGFKGAVLYEKEDLSSRIIKLSEGEL